MRWALMAGAVVAMVSMRSGPVRAEETKVPISFSGGHETDPQDRGRPVVLVAGGLGVAPELFREAFRGVTPARGGPPTGAQARKNKEALMKVLKPHGVTNDLLDTVSDYYRYRPQEGEMWPTAEAKGYALVEGGQVKKIVITDGGSGYSSEPKVTIDGMKTVKLKTTLAFSRDLKKNGAVASVEVAKAEKR